MTRGGLAMTIKTLLIRRSSSVTTKAVVGRCMSKVAGLNEYNVEVELLKHEVQYQDKEYKEHEESGWIPDPRTGIYHPKGHEQVLKDVPDGAASLAYNHWLRGQ